ncbi:MAG: O-antigen ligase family protein [Lysobacter sp.]|nr:O-antigen ligase family protein [Lysobacter sp.]
MSALNVALAAVILYMPYQQHYGVVLDLKGLNLMNLLFVGLLVVVLVRAMGLPAGAAVRTPTPLKGRFVLFFVALAVAFLVAQAGDSTHFLEELTHLKNAVFYMLFFFLYYHAVRDERSIRFLFGAILLATAIVSLQGLRQAVDLGGIYGFAPHRRVTGPFGAGSVAGANLAAAFYAIFVPLFMAVFLLCKSRPLVRLASLPLAALGLFAAFYTYSRQAYFILASQGVLLTLRRHLVIGVLLVAAVLNYELWAPQVVVDRIQMTGQEDPEGDRKLDKSTASRFVLWQGAMQLFAERPWGIGLGRFKGEIGAHAPDYANFDAHNGFVLVLTEAGILGFAALAWLLAGLVKLGRQAGNLDDSEDGRVLATGYLVSVAGAVAVNFFGSRLFDGAVMGNFWILTALVARYVTLGLERQAAGRASAGARDGAATT